MLKSYDAVFYSLPLCWCLNCPSGLNKNANSFVRQSCMDSIKFQEGLDNLNENIVHVVVQFQQHQRVNVSYKSMLAPDQIPFYLEHCSPRLTPLPKHYSICSLPSISLFLPFKKTELYYYYSTFWIFWMNCIV